MSGGGVLVAFGGAQAEAPRLTTMLRAYATERGGEFDVDAEYLNRKRALEARRKRTGRPMLTALGQTGLGGQLFGSWETIPRAARESYERFLKAVSELVGGEMSSEELQESAAVIWRANRLAPPLEKVQGRGSSLALKPIKDALLAAFGHIEADALQPMVVTYYDLKRWHDKINTSKSETGHSTQVGGMGKQGLMEHEFGHDLDFKQPNFNQTAESAVLAMCGMRPEEVGVGIDRRVSGSDPISTHDIVESFTVAEPAPLAAPEPQWEPDEDSDDEKGTKQKVGLKWLQQWCTKMANSTGHDVNDLALAVCRILLPSESGNQMANELCDLLGWEAVELISDLVENRTVLRTVVVEAIAKARALDSVEKGGPSRGTTLTITSQFDKKIQKMERKERKKKGGAVGTDLEWLSAMGFSALFDASNEGRVWLFEGQSLATDGGPRNALPQGTKRRSYNGYEEVIVPAKTASPMSDTERLIPIDELDDWAQLPFQGYKHLNRIQSRIFPSAYYSNENILVCAPTGAGKTNIAMITVLREVGQNMRYGVIQKAEFKIVYVAPMKALAAEMTATFGKRLAPLGLTVKELTGDMQLSKRELATTQMIVTTPEKWDVITRKGGDVSVASLVKLLIIDEVHLLNDDRGPVIETLIARTLRQVEVSQSMIRIVGLSATLPNYEDVAKFLAVNLETGLFYFDAAFRPVPLAMQFVGVSEPNFLKRNTLMSEICFEKVLAALRNGKQAMVFVHSRKDTGKTGRTLAQIAGVQRATELLSPETHKHYSMAKKDVSKSKNKELAELFGSGIGIHHAGMLRSDRSLMERLFSDGVLKVLCCTATLAWGVNLPANTVIIKGTQLYDAQKGGFKDLGMLDVQQIFGRAGRPQFDKSGEGIIITSHDKLPHYLGMLTHQAPIESQFVKGLVDHLNAEIVLGTVTNIKEACTWLSYTYLFVRMLKNPLVYGIEWEQVLKSDLRLEEHRANLVREAARQLEDARMARFDERSGQLHVTELGRVASHFYIKHASIETFNKLLKRRMSEAEILSMISQSSEFETMAVREEELPELEQLLVNSCAYEAKGGVENQHGKVNVLMQTYISRGSMEAFSLIADMMYVSQNAPRICRALFEICTRRGWSTVAETLMNMCKALELRLWPHQHPLRQFETKISSHLLRKLDDRNVGMAELYELDADEISRLLRQTNSGHLVKECLEAFPSLKLEAHMQPITRSVLQVRLEVTPTFKWKERQHGNVMRWLIWVEDTENEHIYHSETWMLTKAMMKEDTHKLTFTIPIFEPLPPHYCIRAINDTWLESEALLTISFKSLILPGRMIAHTELLDLDPLPVTVLHNALFQSLYGKFSHFNPIQTQAFHTLFHTDENVLLGAPTGSGKTISAELAMLRVFDKYPDQKIIYIAPLKALVRERLDDWGKGLCVKLNKKMVELTGDYTPDIRALNAADIIIATPEKWDGISRNWQSRGYVRKVCLMVIDEIHLLGADRGPIIEVIVSRMRYIASQMKRPVRFLGLSTALANAPDVAEWMGVEEDGLFNFKPSVRPVPLECHIQGYPGKFYCPRMATMNKPAYAAIQSYSPLKPILVFVSSRRQTRLTALDLIAFAAADEKPQQWVHMDQDELEDVLAIIKDANLKHTLQFGIGMHHAGLNDRDRSVVERLYVQQKIQVLVATSTLAWGVNTPAHLVIIKGTEYFDAPTRRYVDFPITDVLQMMGRAGRPQFDQHGVAVIMVHEPKKAFYKKFLYEPFPVESSLPEHVSDHLNAEIVAGTVSTKQEALDYLTWTYFFRRLLQNPSFYGLEGTEHTDVNDFLSGMVEDTLGLLERAGCLLVHEDDSIEPLTMGRIASYFYLKNQTMAMFTANLSADMDFKGLLQVLCHSAEYDELPVRHNEDKLNTVLSREVRWRVDPNTVGDPHTKANLLLQAHMSRMALPISDYVTDTKSVLDNSLRILQAMVDISADAGWLGTSLTVMNLVQSIMQGRWLDDSSLQTLPHITKDCLGPLEASGILCLPQFMAVASKSPSKISGILQPLIGAKAADQALEVASRLPVLDIAWKAPHLQTNRPNKATPGEASSSNDTPTEDEQDYVLELSVNCHRQKHKKGPGVAVSFAPRFPKVKDEGWWIVIGDAGTRELYALKRLSVRDRQHTRVKLRIPVWNSAGDALKSVTVFVMSDCYLGLDQQYEIALPGQK